MNDLLLLRDAGPAAPPLGVDARCSARAALLAEIEASTTVRGRVRARLPRRRTALRLGVAATATAVAWTAAVVIAAPDEIGPLPTAVTLVAFEPPAFPLSLDPVPPGLTPSFSADPGGILHAGYGSPATDDRVSITVTPEEPELYGVSDTEHVSVNGTDAELVVETNVHCDRDGNNCREVPSPALVWEQADDRWVTITGAGRYGGGNGLTELAERLVERPQRVPLQVHLAPAGWSVLAYKDDRILTLVDDAHEQHTLNVFLPEAAIPADRLVDELMGPIGPVIGVTVNGRPAELVRIDPGLEGSAGTGWYLQARFRDGTPFVVQAPPSFTEEQVLAFAGQVTYLP
jgi:hypothetical protein